MGTSHSEALSIWRSPFGGYIGLAALIALCAAVLLSGAFDTRFRVVNELGVTIDVVELIRAEPRYVRAERRYDWAEPRNLVVADRRTNVAPGASYDVPAQPLSPAYKLLVRVRTGGVTHEFPDIVYLDLDSSYTGPNVLRITGMQTPGDPLQIERGAQD